MKKIAIAAVSLIVLSLIAFSVFNGPDERKDKTPIDTGDYSASPVGEDAKSFKEVSPDFASEVQENYVPLSALGEALKRALKAEYKDLENAQEAHSDQGHDHGEEEEPATGTSEDYFYSFTLNEGKTELSFTRASNQRFIFVAGKNSVLIYDAEDGGEEHLIFGVRIADDRLDERQDLSALAEEMTLAAKEAGPPGSYGLEIGEDYYPGTKANLVEKSPFVFKKGEETITPPDSITDAMTLLQAWIGSKGTVMAFKYKGEDLILANFENKFYWYSIVELSPKLLDGAQKLPLNFIE